MHSPLNLSIPQTDTTHTDIIPPKPKIAPVTSAKLPVPVSKYSKIEAVELASRKCIEEDILEEFLKQNQS